MLAKGATQTHNTTKERHRFQLRKGDHSAYINHPLRVALHLIEVGVHDLSIIQAATLHDTVEDTDTTLAEISELFGDAVAQLVAEVSDDKHQSKAERKRQQVESARTCSPGAYIIKLADTHDNLRSLLDQPPIGWSNERVRGYFVWKKAVVGARDTHTLPDFASSAAAQMQSELNELFAKVIDASADEAALLDQYYASMAAIKEPEADDDD